MLFAPSDISTSDISFLPVADITIKWSKDQEKEEINKGWIETGSDASVQKGRQAET